MTVRAPSRWLPLFALAGIAGCSPKIQEQYDVEIVGPVDQDVLTNAATVALELNQKEIAHTAFIPGGSFQLTATGLDPRVSGGTGIFRVLARDAAGMLVAQGQTPPIELIVTTPPEPYRIFVQPPGTLGRAPDLAIGRHSMIAASTTAKRNTAIPVAEVTVALFGLGAVQVSGQPDLASADLRVYSPLTHFVAEPNLTGGQISMHLPRSEAAAVARADGSIAIFGGTTPVGADQQPTAQLEILGVTRDDFDSYGVQAGAVRNTDIPGIARSRPALVDTPQLIFAFGGQQSGGQGLDSVVAMNPSLDNTFTLLPAHMAGTRVGHTATGFNVGGLPEILVFGGADQGVAVAEVFVSATSQFVAPTGEAGPMRRDHVALLLPTSDASVLIVGGVDRGDVPLGSSIFYSAKDRHLSPGPITLQTPRYAFTTFIIENDLVIAGGIDAQGGLVANAEIFTIEGAVIRPKAVVPAYPRWGAASALLGNRSVVLLGGTDAHGASAAVELYQPNL